MGRTAYLLPIREWLIFIGVHVGKYTSPMDSMENDINNIPLNDPMMKVHESHLIRFRDPRISPPQGRFSTMGPVLCRRRIARISLVSAMSCYVSLACSEQTLNKHSTENPLFSTN